MLFNVVNTLDNGKDTLVVFADSDLRVLKSEVLSTESLAELEKLAKQDNFKGSVGCVSYAYNLTSFKNLGYDRVVMVGLGNTEPHVKVKDLKKAISTLVKLLSSVKATSLTVLLPEALLEGYHSAARTGRVFVEALNESRYQFKRFKTMDKKANGHSEDCSCCTGVKTYNFFSNSDLAAEFEKGLLEGRCVSAGIKLARDLGNLPANICTPKYLSEIGQKLARDYDKITVDVLDEKEMEDLGMNCYLAVGRGSVNRPFMTVVRYNGASDKNERPYVFVGKGMTFDAGGYSLKPAASMEEMIYDMCGAASVLGLSKAVAELDLPINFIGVAAGCENLVDADAYRPGDILKSLNGLTVEINNTDAEGRLVLCDALTYVDRFNPRTVVDIATLTGACMVALGSRITGVFSNDDSFAQSLVRAGEYTGDEGWHLPLNDDFRDDMKGNHADLTNSGGRFGGASTAAAFLSYFTEDYTWAHLDIAGTGWVSGKNHLATGRPVSLMVKWLQQEISKKINDKDLPF